jgi:molecular chaperone GrpE
MVDEQAIPTEEPSAEEAETGVLECAVEGELEAEPSIEQLQQQLAEAQAQAAEYLDGWQRARAEFANYRRRQEAERELQMQMANAALLTQLLPVVDDLERALDAAPDSAQGQSWLEGVQLIKRKLEFVLESQGVRPIETAGCYFDPTYHEAVASEEAEGYEEGQIIAEVRRGYMLGDRVLRPAMVRVARPAMPPTPETDKTEEA